MAKVKIYKKVISFLISNIDFLKFLLLRERERFKYGRYNYPYNEKLKNQRGYVLANGPSLLLELKELQSDALFLSSPKIVANNFVSSAAFMELKPEFYCLADPAFYKKGTNNEKAKVIIDEINNKTMWKMNLFVPVEGYSIIQQQISNPQIHIHPISTILYMGYGRLKYRYYKRGIASPSFVNVTIMMEYILLNKGCKAIRLYGVDHTFFDGLMVDDNNIPCIHDKHFYGDEYRPLRHYNGGYFTTAGWLMDKYLTFKEHENMRGYADYLGAKIINCTKCSLIDAYVRESQLNQE